MQQRIVVKVPMRKEKDRSKAMKIAAGIIGVSSVKIGGEEGDRVIVIGNEVDAVILTQLLIKKFGRVTRLVRLEPLILDYSHRFHDQDQAYSSYNNSVHTQPIYYYTNPPPPPPYYYNSNCSIF